MNDLITVGDDRLVQSLLIEKTIAPTLERAAAFARSLGYSTAVVRETEGSWRFQQQSPGNFDPGSYQTRVLQRGIKVVVARPRAAMKKFIKTKVGESVGEVANQELWAKWRSLVNMSAPELKRFYHSAEGKEAGLSREEARSAGIHSGRESAAMLLKMIPTGKTFAAARKNWTPSMWRWASSQVSFISRMRGMRSRMFGDPFVRNGKKTRWHLSLLIWGHNPKKAMRSVTRVGASSDEEKDTNPAISKADLSKFMKLARSQPWLAVSSPMFESLSEEQEVKETLCLAWREAGVKALSPRMQRLYAADCIEHVLPLFKRVFPENDVIDIGLDISRRFAFDDVSELELYKHASAIEIAWIQLKRNKNRSNEEEVAADILWGAFFATMTKSQFDIFLHDKDHVAAITAARNASSAVYLSAEENIAEKQREEGWQARRVMWYFAEEHPEYNLPVTVGAIQRREHRIGQTEDAQLSEEELESLAHHDLLAALRHPNASKNQLAKWIFMQVEPVDPGYAKTYLPKWREILDAVYANPALPMLWLESPSYDDRLLMFIWSLEVSISYWGLVNAVLEMPMPQQIEYCIQLAKPLAFLYTDTFPESDLLGSIFRVATNTFDTGDIAVARDEFKRRNNQVILKMREIKPALPYYMLAIGHLQRLAYHGYFDAGQCLHMLSSAVAAQVAPKDTWPFLKAQAEFYREQLAKLQGESVGAVDVSSASMEELLALASDPKTPSSVLEAINNRSIDEGTIDFRPIDTALASNPNSPEPLLFYLAQYHPMDVYENPALQILFLEDPGLFKKYVVEGCQPSNELGRTPAPPFRKLLTDDSILESLLGTPIDSIRMKRSERYLYLMPSGLFLQVSPTGNFKRKVYEHLSDTIFGSSLLKRKLGFTGKAETWAELKAELG